MKKKNLMAILTRWFLNFGGRFKHLDMQFIEVKAGAF
jgi:hypothetical protein